MAQENLQDVIKDLRKSLAWLDLVLATLNEGVLTLGKDLKIHFANDAMAGMLKTNRIFMLGKPIWDALPLSKDALLLKETDYRRTITNNDIQSLSGIYNLNVGNKTLTVSVSFGYISKINQIAIVLRDVTKLHQESAYVRLHQEIATAANESTTFEEAMCISLELVCKHLQCSVGHVYLLNKDNELIPSDVWYLNNPKKFINFRKITESEIFKKGQGLPGRVLSTGKPVWITDVNEDDNFTRIKQAKEAGIKSGIAFPVLTRKEVVAVLEFFSTTTIEPNKQLLQVIAHIGTQLGRVVERIRSEKERMALIREQSAREEAELSRQKIQLSEIRYRTMIEQSPLSIQILSPEGLTLQVNKAWKKLWGISMDKLKGYNMLKDNQLEELGIMPYIKKGFKGETSIIPAVKYDTQKTVKNIGNVPAKWVRAFIYPVKDDKNKIREVVLIHEDITKQKRNDEILQYHASLSQSISDAVISTDMDFKIMSWNQAAEDLYGWSENEVLGHHAPKILATEYIEDVKLNFSKELMRQGYWKGEVIQRRKDGTPINILASISIIKNENGVAIGAVSVNRDITDRKKLEQRKDDFVALASHELKTPVTSLKMYSQILEQRFIEKGDEESTTMISKMDHQLTRLNNLITGLLDVSRVQAGKLEYKKDNFSVDDLVYEIIENIQRITKTHKIFTDGQTKQNIIGDRDRIGQVLTNLINNAIKYSPEANQVIVHSEKKRDSVLISVKDFGMGIPKREQPRVFDRFFQSSNPIIQTYPGLGLGLYISKEIVDRHNGKIWVESTEGKGSTFNFTLPINLS
ncbi:MAG TPA: PAS domain S-box protein [Candidatus Nitrosocosmicus sp.]|nr:PAS domain S-box protein [Candidatus Nitrosocosmicus sp.]